MAEILSPRVFTSLLSQKDVLSILTNWILTFSFLMRLFFSSSTSAKAILFEPTEMSVVIRLILIFVSPSALIDFSSLSLDRLLSEFPVFGVPEHEVVNSIVTMISVQIILGDMFIIFIVEYVIMIPVNQYRYDTTIGLDWLIL